MNHREVIARVSEVSGVNYNDCQKVLDAFEEVLSDQLLNTNEISSVINKVLSIIKNR